MSKGSVSYLFSDSAAVLLLTTIWVIFQFCEEQKKDSAEPHKHMWQHRCEIWWQPENYYGRFSSKIGKTDFHFGPSVLSCYKCLSAV